MIQAGSLVRVSGIYGGMCGGVVAADFFIDVHLPGFGTRAHYLHTLEEI